MDTTQLSVRLIELEEIVKVLAKQVLSLENTRADAKLGREMHEEGWV